MRDCIFCKIVRKEIPAEIVYEDGHTLAFLDVNPRAPGHTLVIPKTHAPNLFELDDRLIGDLFRTVKRVASAAHKAVGSDGVTYGINQGRSSGQEVDHLHIHIMPRFASDGGSSVQAVVANLPQEGLKSIAGKITRRILFV